MTLWLLLLLFVFWVVSVSLVNKALGDLSDTMGMLLDRLNQIEQKLRSIAK